MGIVFGVISVEKPAYEVLAVHPEYEIRKYSDQLVAAEVTSTDWDTKKGFDSNGFRVLAKYIGVFGTAENQGKSTIAMTAPVVSEMAPEKIAMTAPVVSEMGATCDGTDADAAETMAFYLPKSFTMETAPTPNDARVKLRPVAPRVAAVHSFTWGCNMKRGVSKHDELIELLKRDGVALAEGLPWSLARYNPPFTISFLRTNEIHIPVVPPAASASPKL